MGDNEGLYLGIDFPPPKWPNMHVETSYVALKIVNTNSQQNAVKRNGGPKWQICGLLLCLRYPASLRETERSAGAAGTTNPSRTATAAELVMIGCAASAVCTMHVEHWAQTCMAMLCARQST